MTIKSHNSFFGSGFNSLVYSGFNSFGADEGLRFFNAFQTPLTGVAHSWLIGPDPDVSGGPGISVLDNVFINGAGGTSGYGGPPLESVPCTGLFTNEGLGYIMRHRWRALYNSEGNFNTVVRSPRFMRLISGAGFNEFSINDTFDDHPGWTELVGSFQPTDGTPPPIENSYLPHWREESHRGRSALPAFTAELGISDRLHRDTDNLYTTDAGPQYRGGEPYFSNPTGYYNPPIAAQFVTYRAQRPIGRRVAEANALIPEPHTNHETLYSDSWFPRFGNATATAGGAPSGATPRGFFIYREDNTRGGQPTILFGLLTNSPFAGIGPGIPNAGGRIGYTVDFTLASVLP